MRILLDTRAFLCWLAGSPRLVETARRAIADDDNDVLISAASAWEIATKYRLGKLPEADALASDIRAAIAGQGFEELPVSVGDAQRAGRLTGSHRDPFDRMLIAQALAHDLAIVSTRECSTRTVSTGCGDPATVVDEHARAGEEHRRSGGRESTSPTPVPAFSSRHG